MKKITLEDLDKAHACISSMDAFQRLFGSEVEVNEKNLQSLLKDPALVGNAEWAARLFLNDQNKGKFSELDYLSHGYCALTCLACRAQWKKFVELYTEQENA